MDDTLDQIFLAQSNGSFAYHVIKLIMWHAATWSMRKMGRVIIHSENIWVARLFRRSAAMLTHYAVSLVLEQRPNFNQNSFWPKVCKSSIQENHLLPIGLL